MLRITTTLRTLDEDFAEKRSNCVRKNHPLFENLCKLFETRNVKCFLFLMVCADETVHCMANSMGTPEKETFHELHANFLASSMVSVEKMLGHVLNPC
ncbi:hypothetical protein CDAR_521191 [Caerostris darwini]|uniref:Uncharacterized protein n=1 Tax=Caerostris darwini TaxID=1538125 RepID=A0AAV4VA89_9ARAC|nr:hypothetical protein CDAR_521191 [Caerostris darwini]